MPAPHNYLSDPGAIEPGDRHSHFVVFMRAHQGVLTILGELQLLMRLVLPLMIRSTHRSKELALFVGLEET